MHYKTKKLVSKVVWAVILLFFFVITVYPIIWMLAGSLKDPSEFYKNIWGFSKNPQFSNYLTAWKNGNMGQKFINSIIVTAGSLLVLIPVNSFAAYAIARLKFKFRKSIYMLLLLGIMIPSGVLGIPTFSVALKLGLTNSRFGLIMVYAAQSIAMGVFIMRSFFISLPKELEEAAMIDGCTRFKSFTHIILPLAMAGVATQVVFNGLTIWNEYFMANIMINNPNLHTLPLVIANFKGQHNIEFPVLFAALSIVTIPVVIVYIFAQKSFIEGVSAGAVKG
jgi:ABC-type glycerol-3-phosphate transport system permease component